MPSDTLLLIFVLYSGIRLFVDSGCVVILKLRKCPIIIKSCILERMCYNGIRTKCSNINVVSSGSHGVTNTNIQNSYQF